jgi:hypothetical protein
MAFNKAIATSGAVTTVNEFYQQSIEANAKRCSPVVCNFNANDLA